MAEEQVNPILHYVDINIQDKLLAVDISPSVIFGSTERLTIR